MKYLIGVLGILIASIGFAAEEIYLVRGSGPITKTTEITITNEETSIGGLNWDGRDGGGYNSFTIFRDDQRIVVKEKSTSSFKGISNETISTTFIPLSRLPQVIKLSQESLAIYSRNNPLPKGTEAK